MNNSRFRQIHTSNSDYCLDVYGGIKTSNIPVISSKCHAGTNQNFLKEVINNLSNYFFLGD